MGLFLSLGDKYNLDILSGKIVVILDRERYKSEQALRFSELITALENPAWYSYKTIQDLAKGQYSTLKYR